jgi:glucokinase
MFNHAAAIGADIGRNSIRLAVVKMNGEIISSLELSLTKKQSSDYIIAELTEAIREIRMKVALQGINPICVGIAAKGFIDHKAGVIIGPDQGISNWTKVPLSRLINEATGLPAFIGNDASMMTIAEHQFGVAKGYSNVVFVALRTGIGGGIIINGKLYRGVNNAGGEIGQMIINFDGSVSDLGVKGSLEHLASASAVMRRFKEETRNDESKPLSFKEIYELSKTGHLVAVNVINENAEIVGIGIANLISIFAPEIIVIGGGMSEAGAEYISMIRKSAFENLLENFRTGIKIEKASLGINASLMGSAYYALFRLAGKTI